MTLRSARGISMYRMPKLVIKVFGDPGADVCELEEAKGILNFHNGIVVMEGKDVHSHDELVQLVSRAPYRDKEFIEVVQIPPVEGG